MTRAAQEAIDRLRNARDEIELALRVPGKILPITRKVAEAIIDDIAAVGRLIRKMAEGGRE